jgi:integrase
VILQSVLQRAVEWERIAQNPARVVRKPPAKRNRAVRPLAPEAIERIRAELLRHGRHRDALLVSVLAYAGLRPGEALGLAWEHVRDRTLLIEQSVSRGELKKTKTGQTRTVRLLAPLATDLAEWRLASGRPASDAFVFPTHDGRSWSHDDWGNWRNRVYGPTAQRIGFERARPYDLRHSFCSLLIHEGATVVEIARQLGHSPTMTLNTYGHVFDELQGTERLSAEEQIRQARAKHVSVLCPPEPNAAEKQEEGQENSLQTKDGRSWTRTRDLLLIREAL